MRLIDADALRKKIENWKNDADKGSLFSDSVESFAYDEVLDAIDAAPTIDPNIQRPVASWKEHRNYMWERTGYLFCSRCNKISEKESKYCPHCGAVMIGE